MPHDLLYEVQRLEFIEHNTLIIHGFQNGTLVPVPDIESENSLTHKYHKIKCIQEYTNKRKKNSEESDSKIENIHEKQTCLHTASSRATKRIKPVCSKFDSFANQSSQLDSLSVTLTTPIGAGCQWSSTNWSCAYDSVFMILFHIYKQACPSCLKAWIENSNDFSKCLSSLFHSLLEHNSNLNSPSHFNTSRDQFHDKLSMHNPESFP